MVLLDPEDFAGFEELGEEVPADEDCEEFDFAVDEERFCERFSLSLAETMTGELVAIASKPSVNRCMDRRSMRTSLVCVRCGPHIVGT